MCCPRGHRANSRDFHLPAGCQSFLQHHFLQNIISTEEGALSRQRLFPRKTEAHHSVCYPLTLSNWNSASQPASQVAFNILLVPDLLSSHVGAGGQQGGGEGGGGGDEEKNNGWKFSFCYRSKRNRSRHFHKSWLLDIVKRFLFQRHRALIPLICIKWISVK